jgi:hypothetical protein
MENTDPQRTLELLDQLQAAGFGNDAFIRLHHFQQHSEGPPRYIGPHRAYCRRTKRFKADSNNARLQSRLALVLQWHRDRGGSFIDLAEASVREAPFRPL